MRQPALLVLLAGLTAAPLVAQRPDSRAAGGGSRGQRCRLEFENRPQTRLHLYRQPSGQYNSFIGGGVVGHCRAQNQSLVADSAEFYGDRRLLFLIGNVHYTEPRATLDSKRLTYWMNEERLRAEGDVNATLPSGTSMQGPVADYYRAVPNVRATSRLVATKRPTITLVQRDSVGRASDPMTVIANTVVSEADSLVYASGQVQITRPDVVARSDSAAMDRGAEQVRLLERPQIQGTGERPFTLTGAVIDLFALKSELERVVSTGSAKAVSESVTLVADTLDFRLADALLNRSYAWGPSRARATSPTFDIVADSLDVRMPQQRLREVRALRRAVAHSTPDTARLPGAERDWLRGDSIIALFDSTRVDSASQPAIQQLVAIGRAQSFFQIASRDTAVSRPAINYVRGREITVAFVDREVRSVAVIEQTGGVYLEPTRPTTAPSAEQAESRTGARRRP